MIFSQFGVPYNDRKPDISVCPSSRLTFFSNIKLKKRIGAIKEDNTNSEMFEKNYKMQNRIIFNVSKDTIIKERQGKVQPIEKKNALKHLKCANIFKKRTGSPKQNISLSVGKSIDFKCNTKYLELTDTSENSNYDQKLSCGLQNIVKSKAHTNSVSVQTIEPESLLSLPSCSYQNSKKFSSEKINLGNSENFQCSQGNTLPLVSIEVVPSKETDLLCMNEVNQAYNKIFSKKNMHHFKSLISKHQLETTQKGGIITNKTISRYLQEFASKSKDNQRILEINKKLDFYKALIDFSLPILKNRLIKNEASELRENNREAKLSKQFMDHPHKFANKKKTVSKPSINC